MFSFPTICHSLKSVTYERRYGALNVVRSLIKCDICVASQSSCLVLPHWLCTEWKPRMMMGNQHICNSNFDFPRFTELLAGYRTSNCHKWGIILKLNPSPFRQQLNQYRIFEIQANGIQFSNFRGEEFWALTMLKSVTFDLWPNHIHSAVSLSRWNRLQWMTCRWKGKHFGFLII